MKRPITGPGIWLPALFLLSCCVEAGSPIVGAMEASGIPDWSTSAVDLSFLNAPERPAGKHGFLRASAAGLAFEDGTPVRFWGTNLTADALFRTPSGSVKQQARRLSALGFNLVRLHHHDSFWVDPNIFGKANASDTQYLNPFMLEKIDWWIKCLKDEGIYIWLDLHVQRHLKPQDGISDINELLKGKPSVDLKGYSYLNHSIQLAMKRFNEAYVGHRNIYTNTPYYREPAIVAMLITNENDITNHFGNLMLPDRNVPKHNERYMREANAFADAWGLSREKVRRSWEYGPAKLFLNDLEYRVNLEMTSHLRTQGVRVPIVTTSTWSNPLSSLPALTAGNLIDVHSYGGTDEFRTNPVYKANMMHWIAAAHISGYPLSVSEWNVQPFPVPDRHAIPLYMAAFTRLQGVAAVIQYAYAQTPLNTPGIPSNWAAFNDPSLIATLPAAALLFRRGDVQEASTIYTFAPTPDQLFNQQIDPDNAAGLRTAAEKGKLLIVLPSARELPWLKSRTTSSRTIAITTPQQPLIRRDATEITTDTGELTRNWKLGTYTINTPRTQSAMGWMGGQPIILADVAISITTPNATVSVQSLTGRPIHQSRSILISLGSGATPINAGRLPFRSSPLHGRLSIRAPAGLNLYVASMTKESMRPLAPPYKNGRYQIDLDKNSGNQWLVLKGPPPQSPQLPTGEPR